MPNTLFTLVSFLVVAILQVIFDLFIEGEIHFGRLIFTLGCMFFIVIGYYLVNSARKISLDVRISTTHILLSAFFVLLIVFTSTIASRVQDIEPRRYYTFNNYEYTPFPVLEIITIQFLLFLVCQVTWLIWIISKIIRAKRMNPLPDDR